MLDLHRQVFGGMPATINGNLNQLATFIKSVANVKTTKNNRHNERDTIVEGQCVLPGTRFNPVTRTPS